MGEADYLCLHLRDVDSIGVVEYLGLERCTRMIENLLNWMSLLLYRKPCSYIRVWVTIVLLRIACSPVHRHTITDWPPLTYIHVDSLSHTLSATITSGNTIRTPLPEHLPLCNVLHAQLT